MQSKLRTKIAAAALLLAPVAALVAAQPAAAQQRYDDHRYEQDRDWRDHRDWRDDRAHQNVPEDRGAPEIYDVTPNTHQVIGGHGPIRISAHYRDYPSGVDVRSVALRVDNRDVTRWAHVDDQDVSFDVDLKPGHHMAELFVRDRAGNVAHRAWDFEVVPGHGFYQVDPRDLKGPARPWE